MYHRSKDKILSKIGYYNDQKGIMNRYLREVNNWNIHLEKSKKAILEGISGKSRNKVIILGSGWLLDVPIRELAESFQEVWLADVYHPPQVIKKVSSFSNIKFMQMELTGMAEQIYTAAKVFRKTKFKTPVQEFKSTIPIDLSQYDYVISCNIFSQLDIILTDFLKQYQVYTAEEIEDITRLIQLTHLDALPRNKTTLICDQEEWVMDAQELETRKRLLILVPLPGLETMSTWIWKFDSQMTYYNSLKTYFKVAALYF
jgi:hypothetical protein